MIVKAGLRDCNAHSKKCKAFKSLKWNVAKMLELVQSAKTGVPK